MMSVSTDSVKDFEDKVTPVIQRISPRTIPGLLTVANKGSIDWGWQSFVAYGCHNHVIVIDTQNVKAFQTLEQHKADVVKVKWAKESYYHDLSHPYTLKLASADNIGNIIVWNVKEAKTISSFSESSKPALEIEWLTGRDSCQNLLVALHPLYSFIVWDTISGSKLWKKTYTEPLLSFAFDPFSGNRMAFLAADCILFVDDFNLSKAPSSNGRKFYISNPSTSSGAQSSNNSASSSLSTEDRPRPATRSIIPKRMRFLVRADSKLSEEGVTLNECLQLCYHRSYRHHLLLLYSREILILDLEINQTVGIVSVEHNGSAMLQLHSCWQRDAFFMLHENGSVTFRLRHRGLRMMAAATPLGDRDIGYNSNDVNLEVAYDLHCQSDALRLTKHAKVVGMAVCPVSENKVSLLVSDGRMLFLELIVTQKLQLQESLGCWAPHMASVMMNVLCGYSVGSSGDENPFPKLSDIPHPSSTLSDNIGPALYPREEFFQSMKDTIKCKLFITGNLCAVAAPPHVIRMCPPVTFRNWKTYQPYMAIGNAGGTVQVIDMATGLMRKEYSVHTSPVRGIEWLGLTSFMSYAHPNVVSSLGHVRNELVLTDIQSGRTKSLRGDRHEESPIEMIRVSYLRQYAIVVFKEEPFELWDLRLLTLLRIMPKNFPTITALEWSPVHKKHQSSLDFTLDKMKEYLTNDHATENEMAGKSLTYSKEHFVFTDTNGQLHHFSVEGNILKDGTTIPADAGMGCITCIAWKSDYIVLGDVDGNLNILNLKKKISKGIPTHRGWIKKIRFGPGKGNFKILVLCNDGVDVWDVKDHIRVHAVRCPRDLPKVRDIDWASSERPALATADGCIRITDIELLLCSSPIYEYERTEMPFSPHLLSDQVAFYLKSYLQHLLPVGKEFNTAIDQQEDFDVKLAAKQYDNLDTNIKAFLKDCPFGIAERSLHISRLFGDEEACHFWNVALYFLKESKSSSFKVQHISETEQNDQDSNLEKVLQENKSRNNVFFEQPLDTGYDVFCDNDTYKRLQLDRVSLHVHKRSTYSQTQQCAERLLLLGQTDRAVQLLLETEPGSENFYVDCLRACLTATIESSGTSQSIIKLVSTNLIASGHILEGVQLLCLIEKGMDACRYLLGSGRWDEAVWLAKATLCNNECQEILRRWIDHLCTASMNLKNKGLLVLLSMHQFWKAIQMMHSFKMVERAALFLQACLEFGVISKTEDNAAEIDNVFLEYSKYLLSIKNRTSAIHYCSLVSEIGDDLKKQIEFINDDKS